MGLQRRRFGRVTQTPTELEARAPGVRITACTRGGHLMTWTTEGVERLWMSPLSGCGGTEAIRGGVPILFPQFSVFGALPRHGFLRTSDWHPRDAPSRPGRAHLAFDVEDSPQTRAIWPHPFHARLDISAGPRDLEIVLAVTNRERVLAHFTGGLHTYLAVADPHAWIGGLGGCRAWDGASTDDPAFPNRLADRIRALDGQDLIISGVPGPVVLSDAVLGRLHVAAEGFPHRVVWNPGPGHALPDVAPGDEAGFVCIEAAAVTPVALPAGSTWTGRQHLTVL